MSERAGDGALDTHAGPDGPGATRGRPAARRRRGWPWALLAPLAAGAVVGVAWRLLAPTARVQAVMSGKTLLVDAPKDPELFAAQDGTLLLLGVLAGVVTGVVVVVRARRRPLTATVLAAVGSALGSGLAVVVGHALGPASLAAQGFRAGAAAADQPALVSPLSVHAPGVVLVWPLLTLVVAALGHAVVASRLGRRARRDESATPHRDVPTAALTPPRRGRPRRRSGAPGPPAPAPRPGRAARR